MKPVILAAGFSILATAVAAQANLSSRQTSCQALAAAVRANGAVTITTAPGVYDRYVRDQGLCPLGYLAQPAFVPASDTPQCFAGNRCVSNPSRYFAR